MCFFIEVDLLPLSLYSSLFFMITRLAQRERRIIIYVMQLFGCNYIFKVLPSIDCILGTARFFKSSIFALDNSGSFGRLPDWSVILAYRSNEKLNYKNEWRGLKVKVEVGLILC